jgi:hypothetical protein
MKKVSVLTAALFCIAALVRPLGQEEPERTPPPERALTGAGLYENALEGQLVELTGRVRLVGNEPFPELVLTGEDGHSWFIAPEDRTVLSAYEQRIVTIRGRVKLQEMILADGQRLETRRILSGVTLIRYS